MTKLMEARAHPRENKAMIFRVDVFLMWLYLVIDCLLTASSFTLRAGSIRSPTLSKSKNASCDCCRRLANCQSLSGDSSPSSFYLESLLLKHNFGSRLVTFSSFDLPLLAEFQEQGQAQICSIVDLKFDDDEKVKVKLQLLDGVHRMVDMGQLTTVWQDEEPQSPQSLNVPQSHEDSLWYSLPLGHVDQTLDVLYQDRVELASNGNRGLTKKQVTTLIEESPDKDKNTVELVFRQVVKTGSNFARLIDSSIAKDVLFPPKIIKSNNNSLLLRAITANALAKDAQSGGRFKRMPCILVSSYTNHVDPKSSSSVTLINGGWMVVDKSVRASSEARKFAENTSNNKNNDAQTLPTLADERIAHRLECLAMGQVQQADDDDNNLELDVRETLKALKLPTTPEGAKEALVRIGRWSSPTATKHAKSVSPWSETILQAAQWYQKMDQERRKHMYTAIISSTDDDNDSIIEDRVDLTKLPCVCVDAARATFRDDAIGLRPRASTGRKVVPKASKWEVLIHITDVSDIYAPSPAIGNRDANTEFLEILGEAAASRGTSRYDLPLGPLHLLPPVLLHSLGFETVNPDLTASAPIQMNTRQTVNRCATIWVYIDERSGKLIDAGLERSIVSCPVALSFQSATALLDGSLMEEIDNDPTLVKTRGILVIAERLITRWSEHYRGQSEVAQAREKRLEAREMVGKQLYGTKASRGRSGPRGNGQEGFQRTRGHRLVDSCLEMYGYTMHGLLQRANASIPRVAGTGRDRLGRIATAPLRRYVDGVAQRQALSVLCAYGGPPLTKAECAEVGKRATQAINSISNINSSKSGKNPVSTKQIKAAKALRSHLMRDKTRAVPAMSTGKQSEVVILGVGAVAMCRGIQYPGNSKAG